MKKAKLQEELLNSGSNTTTTSTKAGGAKPKLSKAKAAGAAADPSNSQVKRPKARAGGTEHTTQHDTHTRCNFNRH